MTAEVLPFPRGNVDRLHQNLNDLIHLAISLGAPRFIIHEGVGVRFFNRLGREVEWATPDTPRANEEWSSPQAIDHLKRFAAISHPIPVFRQEGGFVMDIQVGGVIETVGVKIQTIPAENGNSGEIVCAQMALKPWLGPWGKATLRIALPTLAFVGGLAQPLPFVLAWVTLFLAKEGAMALMPFPSTTRRLRNRVVSLLAHGCHIVGAFAIGGIVMGYIQGWEGPSPSWPFLMIVCPLVFTAGATLCRWLRSRRAS